MKFLQQNKQIVIGLYWHPEYYPPTLNCINSLLERDYKIKIVCLNLFNGNDSGSVQDNVQIITCGKYRSIREYNQLPVLKKMILWIQFTTKLLIHLKSQSVVLLYDPIPLLSYGIIHKLFKTKKFIWYHNHDILQQKLQRRFSISWFASKYEALFFKYLDLFTLPSEERKQCFPMISACKQYFFLPNYPVIKDVLPNNKAGVNEFIKVIFQGSISTTSGIEHIVDILPFQWHGRRLKIILKGYIDQSYLEQIFSILEQKNCLDCLEYYPPSSYAEVFPLTASCDIGWAVFKSNDIMALTLGTASNKIYEYASAGLPVIYADYPHFTEHLSRFKWAVPTDLSPDDLKLKIINILDNYSDYSLAAINDIKNHINFGVYIRPVLDYITSYIEKKNKYQSRPQ